MVTVFLGIIAVMDILLFIKTIVDDCLGIHFRKVDQKHREEWDRTIQMLAYQITDLKERLDKVEKEKE